MPLLKHIAPRHKVKAVAATPVATLRARLSIGPVTSHSTGVVISESSVSASDTVEYANNELPDIIKSPIPAHTYPSLQVPYSEWKASYVLAGLFLGVRRHYYSVGDLDSL